MKRVEYYYYTYTGLTSFFFTLTFTVSAVYYIQEAGLTAFQLLMVGFALEISCFLFEIPTGVVADFYSRRLSMGLSLALIGTGFLLQGLIPDLAAILVAQLLWGVGYTFLSGADQAWISDELDTDQLEPVFLRGAQLGQIGTLVGIGASVALAQLSLQTPMILSGVLFFAFSLIVTFTYPETRFTPVPRQNRTTWQTMWRTFFEGLKVVKSSPTLVIVLGISLLAGLYSEGFDRLWQLHLLQGISLPSLGGFHDVIWFGLIQAVALILNILAVEWIQRRFQRNEKLEKVWVLMWINGLLAGAILAFAWSGQLWLRIGRHMCCGDRTTRSSMLGSMNRLRNVICGRPFFPPRDRYMPWVNWREVPWWEWWYCSPPYLGDCPPPR